MQLYVTLLIQSRSYVKYSVTIGFGAYWRRSIQSDHVMDTCKEQEAGMMMMMGCYSQRDATLGVCDLVPKTRYANQK